MAQVINLRQARKQKGREAKSRQADAARALHGESKASRLARKAEAERAKALLDGHHREPD